MKGKKRNADSDDEEPEALPSTKRATKDKKRKAAEEDEPGKPAKKHLSKGVKDKLEQDDMEVSFLEKKLKIKNKKVPKAFEEDGLDFLLEGLEDNYLEDKPGKKIKKEKKKPTYEIEDSSDEEDGGFDDILGGASDEEDVMLNEGSEGEEDDLGSEDEDEEEDSEEDGSEGEFGGFSDEDGEEGADSGAEPEAPRVRENPYKAPVPEDNAPAVFTPSATKYIPPSLRKAASTESEQLQRLRRQVQGLLNRLSEPKLIPLLTEVEALYANNPRGDVTNLFTDLIISTICDRSAMLDTFMILHAGFVAAIYKLIGTDFGAHVVQSVVEKFLSFHKTTNLIPEPAKQGKECTNLMAFLSELYNFGVVAPVLVFDFIRMFLSELTELHTELLLKIVRNAGGQLRTDDPTAIKSLALLLQPAIAKAGGEKNLSIRTQFMIETLTNLKNNRLKSGNATTVVTTESTTRMKKLLGTLNTRRLRATEPLRASLDDIVNVATKGKWWLVGASWAGTSASTPAAPTPSAPADDDSSDSEDDSAHSPDLLLLARQHRMNTSIRRAIFITLLSSTDFTDAHTRLQKLHLKRTQSREIPRVLIHCATNESAYNPYYTLIARKLCSNSHALKMTFTFVLWEYFRRFGEEDERHNNDGSDDEDEDGGDAQFETLDKKAFRKIANLARLYGALVNERVLTPGIFKTLKFTPYLKPATKSFLEVFWGSALAAEGSDDWLLAHMADGAEQCRGVAWFLKKRALVVVDGDASAIRKRQKHLVKGLEAVVGRVQGGAFGEE